MHRKCDERVADGERGTKNEEQRTKDGNEKEERKREGRTKNEERADGAERGTQKVAPQKEAPK